MIVVTGAAGFIGSCLVGGLNDAGYEDLILVDDFSKTEKQPNFGHKIFSALVERDEFLDWLETDHDPISFIFHIGARTDTTEFDRSIFDELNLNYTKSLWTACSEQNIPLVYASSAATYGDGELGYKDDHDLPGQLLPLNPYGESKNEFDKWALQQEDTPPFWAGLKFFNVYGPNEYHKGRMASVIFHAFNQIQESDKLNLFRSHNEAYKDGEQLRDFIYVKDVVGICRFLMDNRPDSGLYNVGTGQARTFVDLGRAVFSALQVEESIEFIDTPADIRDKYQYFTEADMAKLQAAGYEQPFYSLEEGVRDYVSKYLVSEQYL
jgi:ADP-L-glycero-D-manno-heptose 6-epimerase